MFRFTFGQVAYETSPRPSGQLGATPVRQATKQPPGQLDAAAGEEEMIVLDVVLMAAIAAAMVGFLTWSICTQQRHEPQTLPQP